VWWIPLASGYSPLCTQSAGTHITTAISYSGGTNICNSTYLDTSALVGQSAGNYLFIDYDISGYGDWVQYNKPGGIGTTTLNKVGGACSAC
jgi:hypothetical protein